MISYIMHPMHCSLSFSTFFPLHMMNFIISVLLYLLEIISLLFVFFKLHRCSAHLSVVSKQKVRDEQTNMGRQKKSLSLQIVTR